MHSQLLLCFLWSFVSQKRKSRLWRTLNSIFIQTECVLDAGFDYIWDIETLLKNSIKCFCTNLLINRVMVVLVDSVFLCLCVFLMKKAFQ